MEKKRLYKTEGADKKICGVCGGVAEYFDVDPTVIRVAWAIATLCSASMGFWVYLICAIIMPNKSEIS